MTTPDDGSTARENTSSGVSCSLTDYIQKHNVYTTLQLAMQSLIKYQPKSPLKYLSSYFGDRKKNLFKLVLLGPRSRQGYTSKTSCFQIFLEAHLSGEFASRGDEP